MEFLNPYWSLATKLDILARWIIVESIIYYALDSSVVSDKWFDENSRQFVRLVDGNKTVFDQMQYGYVMYDFDGSTGFDIYDRLMDSDKEYLMGIARQVLKDARR